MKKPKEPFGGKGDHDNNGKAGGAKAPPDYKLNIIPNTPAPTESWGERQARESIEAEKALAAKKKN